MIRVRADLLDKLVNEAGEVSISRARLDNEIGGIRQSLVELTENVNRLRSQLREIELAADSQIQSQIARNREVEGDFDPLEFDRYTRFQELSRMLAESVNDVATVQQNAMRSLDEAARDLSRQHQVTRELQQDLMRIRLVQFGSVADRMYRVVRQAAKELGKRVNLEIKGGDAELDRGVLERMSGPIEHLLRNAVAHGIESRTDRLAAGKAETGEISLTVGQAGSEVTLRFTDDGAGLNYPRISRSARCAWQCPRRWSSRFSSSSRMNWPRVMPITRSNGRARRCRSISLAACSRWPNARRLRSAIRRSFCCARVSSAWRFTSTMFRRAPRWFSRTSARNWPV
jgi:chemosensory pili system protein ChpA (sensor histidine kinase/response regulator)